MRHVFSRMDPSQTILRTSYIAYQKLAEQHAQAPTLDSTLPAEMRHLHKVNISPSFLDTPEQAELKRKLDKFFQEPQILKAAGELTLELEQRARWLVHRGTVTEDNTSYNRRGKDTVHALRAVLPLNLAVGFSDATATVSLTGEYGRTGQSRYLTPVLDNISVEVNGLNKITKERFSTYASIGSTMLNLAHSDESVFPPHSVYGACLVDAFELRDMLTIVENSTPDTLLPTQPYGKHVARSPITPPA